jgi:hypothetical protein
VWQGLHRLAPAFVTVLQPLVTDIYQPAWRRIDRRQSAVYGGGNARGSQMAKMLALLASIATLAMMGSSAQAFDHGPACPDTFYWKLSRKSYAQWAEFKLFNGSYGEKHKVVYRDRRGVIVKVWRPAANCS